MSASRQKQNRAEQQSEGMSKKAAAAAEQAKKDKSFRKKAIIALVIIVVLVAAALVINSNLFYTHTTAVQVGDTKYSPAEVNYFFMTTFNRIYQYYYSQLGTSVSMVLDPSTALSEQTYTEDKTWADYIFETSQEDMIQITSLYDAAIKAGYTLNEEDNAAVQASLEEMQSMADSNGYPSLNQFLVRYYGKGMTKNLFLRMTEKVTLASRYSVDLVDEDSYTDAELEEYYQAHADEYDYYNYYLYTVATSNAKFEDLAEEEQASAAHDAAAELAEASSVEDFVDRVTAFVGDDYTFNMSHSTSSALGDSYRDWITDSARKNGDVTVVDGETGSTAIMFVGFDDNNYNTVDMRHILVTVEADEDGNYTDEAKAAAKEKLDGIYAEWKLLGSEDDFATLANEYSDDTGSNENGGLYTDITMNQMVPVVNDFLFAPDRAVGDTAIVYNEGSYVGYHLLYMAGINGNYRMQLARDGKGSADYEDAYAQLSAGYDVTVCSGLRFARLDNT